MKNDDLVNVKKTEEGVIKEKYIFGDKQSFNLFDGANTTFLNNMYQEVLFRKKNDQGFNYLTRQNTRCKSSA